MRMIFAQNACVAAGFPISRLLVSGAIVGILAYRSRHQWQKPVIKDKQLVAQIFGFGFFFYFISMGCGAWALMSIPTGYASIAYNMTPFIVALLSYWIFSERLALLQWIGMVIGFCGILWGLQLNPQAQFESGALLILSLAVFGYAYGLVMLKKLTLAGVPAPFINAGGMLVGGVLALGA